MKKDDAVKKAKDIAKKTVKLGTTLLSLSLQGLGIGLAVAGAGVALAGFGLLAASLSTGAAAFVVPAVVGGLVGMGGMYIVQTGMETRSVASEFGPEILPAKLPSRLFKGTVGLAKRFGAAAARKVAKKPQTAPAAASTPVTPEN